MKEDRVPSFYDRFAPRGTFLAAGLTRRARQVRAAAFSVAVLMLVAPAAVAQVSFSVPTNFTADSGAFSIAVADLNGDRKLDLAVANLFSRDVSVMLGDGSGSFGAASNLAVGVEPTSVGVGDFDRDGKPDLVVANAVTDDVSVLLGDGTGGFGAATSFAAGDAPTSVAVGDVNGDGKLDAVV